MDCVCVALAKESRVASNNDSTSSYKAAFLAGNPGEPVGMNVPILSEPSVRIERQRALHADILAPYLPSCLSTS